MSASGSSHHVLPIRLYVGIWLILVALTGVTVTVAFQDLGPLNNVVALSIAVTKATLVILYFMHARYSTRLTKIVIVSAFVWLVILIGFTLADFGSRGWLGVPGK
jgi:cytochrome c oxidase subunit 4